jgi:hypothetical protein
MYYRKSPQQPVIFSSPEPRRAAFAKGEKNNPRTGKGRSPWNFSVNQTNFGADLGQMKCGTRADDSCSYNVNSDSLIRKHDTCWNLTYNQ